ncbi:MAG: DsbA family protein [Pseudobdellovibrionaceae bacterium]
MINTLTNMKLVLFAALISSANLAYASEGSRGCTIAGSNNAAITIQEFADFECKYCVLGANTMKEVLKNYPGKVNLVFRNMPLPFHQNAFVSAKAFSAVCLQNPSLAYSYQKELFENQDKLASQGEPYLYVVAEKLGVDVTKMKSDMNGEAVTKAIAEDQELADAHSFKGTPSFLVGTEEVVGAQPYDEIKKVIDKQLGQ